MFRTPTPDYAELNARFENLIGLIGGSPQQEEQEPPLTRRELEVVHYSCSQPPDIIPRMVDAELEVVSITLEGLQVIVERWNKYKNNRQVGPMEEELPPHLEGMVHRAMLEMEQ